MGANARVVNTPSQAYPNPNTNHEQVTVSSTALDLKAQLSSGALHAGTSYVLLQVTGADIRVTFDGTDPTTSKGFVFESGNSPYWPADLFSKAKVIRDDSVDAVLEIQEMQYR